MTAGKIFAHVILMPLMLVSAVMMYLYSTAPVICRIFLHQTINTVRKNHGNNNVAHSEADAVAEKTGKVLIQYYDSKRRNIIRTRLMRSAMISGEYGMIMSSCQERGREDLAA